MKGDAIATIRSLPVALLACVVGLSCVGCGSTKSRVATEQLLVSDAIDDAISGIDFRSLAGKKVFFDTRYLVNVKGIGFVNAEYVISSLRQQMIAADLRLQEKPDTAQFVVEARVGTLGTDGDEIIYGIPANRGLSEAATLLPNVPSLPAIPEISLARKESQVGAVKVAAYAYERESGEPIWQSGIARAKTSSQDIWLFGAGPFQQGSIHGHTKFAGSELRIPGSGSDNELAFGPPVPFGQEFHFQGRDDAPQLWNGMVQERAGEGAVQFPYVGWPQGTLPNADPRLTSPLPPSASGADPGAGAVGTGAAVPGSAGGPFPQGDDRAGGPAQSVFPEGAPPRGSFDQVNPSTMQPLPPPQR